MDLTLCRFLSVLGGNFFKKKAFFLVPRLTARFIKVGKKCTIKDLHSILIRSVSENSEFVKNVFTRDYVVPTILANSSGFNFFAEKRKKCQFLREKRKKKSKKI